MNIKRVLSKLLKPYQAMVLRRLNKSPMLVAPLAKERPELILLRDKKKELFFGYHDKTPFSADDSKVLAHRVSYSGTSLESECRTIETGYFKKGSNGQFEQVFYKITDTDTWSWQQGSMLQWHPAHPNKQVVLNKMIGSSYGCAVYDITSNKLIDEINHPVYSLRSDGKKGVSVNFSRLARLRPGYGYRLLPDNTEGVSAPPDDGIFQVDMESGESELLISLAEIASNFGKLPDGEHYINHVNFSPLNSRLVYFHIWQPKNARRKIQLGIYNFNSDTNKVIESERVVSHYSWKDEENLLVTTRDEDLNWHYTLYNVVSGKKHDFGIPLKSDGHPMYIQGGNVIVTDTTPDRRRDQHLCIADLENKTVKELIPLYTPYRYNGPVRCDLHPRWNREGTIICVDTTHWGKREMLLVQLPGSMVKEFMI